MALLLFALLIGIPLIEIILFIQVGGVIGGGATILLTLFTAFAGIWIVRLQGFAELARLRDRLSAQREPVAEILNMLFLLFAGLLLLIPGFMTDGVGALLLIPPLRQGVANHMSRHAFFTNLRQKNAGQTIDGEYWEAEPPEKPLLQNGRPVPRESQDS